MRYYTFSYTSDSMFETPTSFVIRAKNYDDCVQEIISNYRKNKAIDEMVSFIIGYFCSSHEEKMKFDSIEKRVEWLKENPAKFYKGFPYRKFSGQKGDNFFKWGLLVNDVVNDDAVGDL
jgi:hypothetical protein